MNKSVLLDGFTSAVQDWTRDCILNGIGIVMASRLVEFNEQIEKAKNRRQVFKHLLLSSHDLIPSLLYALLLVVFPLHP